MVDKIAAIFLFSNGPDHWKHNFLASLDRLIYKENVYVYSYLLNTETPESEHLTFQTLLFSGFQMV